ncbi:MAG: IS21-like element helper ATPase IstB [Acidithiobacillus sp.]
MSERATSQVALDEVTSLCRRLRLKYVREQLEDVVHTAQAQRWEPTEVLRVLLSAEAEGRDRSTIEVKRRRAHFPAGKTLDTWVPSRSSIPASTQQALATLEWVARHENLAIAGPSGTGKSHWLEALGQKAIEQGLSVAWFSVEDLGALVRRHRVDDSVSKAFGALASVSLAVVDDIGLLPVSADAAEGLYRLVDAAYEKRSVAISSNLHPSGLDQLMDKTIASALVDRLLHHAHVIVTEGESVRLADATSGRGVKPLDE